MTRVGVLLSGRGSNFLALHQAMERGEVPARVAIVLANRADAPGIEKARELGLDARVIPHEGLKRRQHDARIVEALGEAGIEWVCLAGYMRILSPVLVDAFPQRILNIHPSLLPSFPGLDAQRQAWDYGVKVSGCTVHLVDHGLDSGPIVLQAAVEIGDAGSAEDVAARILRLEHGLYPLALKRLLVESWRVKGRRVEFLAPNP